MIVWEHVGTRTSGEGQSEPVRTGQYSLLTTVIWKEVKPRKNSAVHMLCNAQCSRMDTAPTPARPMAETVRAPAAKHELVLRTMRLVVNMSIAALVVPTRKSMMDGHCAPYRDSVANGHSACCCSAALVKTQIAMMPAKARGPQQSADLYAARARSASHRDMCWVGM